MASICSHERQPSHGPQLGGQGAAQRFVMQVPSVHTCSGANQQLWGHTQRSWHKNHDKSPPNNPAVHTWLSPYSAQQQAYHLTSAAHAYHHTHHTHLTHPHEDNFLPPPPVSRTGYPLGCWQDARFQTGLYRLKTQGHCKVQKVKCPSIYGGLVGWRMKKE